MRIRNIAGRFLKTDKLTFFYDFSLGLCCQAAFVQGPDVSLGWEHGWRDPGSKPLHQRHWTGKDGLPNISDPFEYIRKKLCNIV
jgi:hypothetical protein